MKALSVRQPWAWLIVNGYKNIENRTWRTHYRGPLLIHAGARPVDQETLRYAKRLAKRHGIELPGEYQLGGIVGEVEVVDCVECSRSPWFQGPIGWVLANTRRRRFRPLKGSLGLFNVQSNSGR